MDIELIQDKDKFLLDDIKAQYETALFQQKQSEMNEKNADDELLDCAIRLHNLDKERVSVLSEMVKIVAQRIVDKANTK